MPDLRSQRWLGLLRKASEIVIPLPGLAVHDIPFERISKSLVQERGHMIDNKETWLSLTAKPSVINQLLKFISIALLFRRVASYRPLGISL